MKFRYIAIDKNGKKIKSVIEATSLQEAKSKLSDFAILEIKESNSFSFNFSKKISNQELAELLTTLGLYIKASIPIITAIKLTKTQTENDKLIKFLDYIQIQIKEGVNFYDAIKKQKIIKIPNYIIESIKIGENSSKLDIVLLEMSKFLKDEEKVQSKITQSLTYPFFIIITAIFVISFMLTTIVPKIVNIFKSLNQDLPYITKIVISVGYFLENNYLILIFFITSLITIIIVLYKKVFKFRFLIDKLQLKIPIFNKIIIFNELGRFSYLTYVLTSSGVNYVEAIELSTNTINNIYIKDLLKKALKKVKEGKNLSTALYEVKFDIDNSFKNAIKVAEETAQVNEILKNLSEIYFEKNQNRINILLNMLEPILIIVVGGIVGIIVTALLLPMLNMNILS